MSLTPVSDPEILKQLDAPAAPASEGALKLVTDPETIKKLEVGPVSEKLRESIAGPLGRKVAAAASNTLRQMDADVDYSGVAAPGLRAEFGFLDTPEERQAFLKEHFGDKNVTQDSFGRDVVTINGQKVAFLPRGDKDSGKPGSNLAGYADVASDILPVAGMVAGSLATAPIPGASIIGAGVGGAGGKGLNKLLKEVAGFNKQEPGEIAKDIALEVPKGMVGQGVAEVIGGLGRSVFRGPFREGSVFGPYTERGKEAFAKVQEEVDAARAMGLTPKVATYSPNANFTQRIQNAGFRLFGDDTVAMNKPVIEREAGKMTGGPLKNDPAATDALNESITKKVDQIRRTSQAVADASEVQAKDALKIAEDLITDRKGPIPPSLAANVAKDIQNAKTAFTMRAAELYAPVDALAGAPVVPTKGIKDVMKTIITEGPQTDTGQAVFASDTIKKFAADIAQLPENITFQQMQVARSTLRDRSAVEALNAGLSERQAARLASAADKAFDDAQSLLLEKKRLSIVGADGKPITTVSPKLVEGVDAAKAALRRADKFYAAGMQRFNDLTVEAMVKDATQAGFVEPERVAARLAVPGQADRLLRIQKSVTPETFGQIGAARWKQLLDESRSPLTGEVDGKMLASRLQKMGPVLDTLYGKSEAANMRSYAGRLAGLNGKIDMDAMRKGGLSALVRDAVMKKEASDAVMSRGFVKELQTDGKESLTAASWLTEPGNRLPLRQALDAFGRGSPEANNLKEYLARRIFSSMEVPATMGAERHGTTELMGEPLIKELNSYGRPYLEEVFGKDWTDSAYQLAKNIEVGTRKNPVDSGGLAAAAMGLHWMRHLGEIGKIFVAGDALSRPGVISYLSKGVGGEGVDFLQKWMGRGTQVAIDYGAEVVPKRVNDNARGAATHIGRTPLGAMLESAKLQGRPQVIP